MHCEFTDKLQICFHLQAHCRYVFIYGHTADMFSFTVTLQIYFFHLRTHCRYVLIFGHTADMFWFEDTQQICFDMRTHCRCVFIYGHTADMLWFTITLQMCFDVRRNCSSCFSYPWSYQLNTFYEHIFLFIYDGLLIVFVHVCKYCVCVARIY